MHIAEGVVIFIMAVLNLGGGLACRRRGGFIRSAGIGMAADPQAAEASEDSAARDDRQRASAVQAAGAIIVLVGVALLILCGLDVAAGVLLFTVKNPAFMFVVAGLQILASVAALAIYRRQVWSAYATSSSRSPLSGARASPGVTDN